MTFQAAVTAIALVACATGKSLDWWGGPPTIPVRVLAETGGAGDDIGLELLGGATAEVQAKKKLQRGADLWTALLKLATGVHEGRMDQGLLAISPGSSRTVAEDLATDIVRLGLGRSDNLTDIGREFVERLQAAGLPVQTVCRKLAIQTVSALEPDGSDIRAAVVRLEGVLASPAHARRGWDVLAADAARLIALRGARTVGTIGQLLQDDDVAFASRDGAAPLAVAAKLRAWTLETNATFSIIGVKTPLSLDDAWIPLKCQVKTPETDGDLAEAMKRYHGWKDRASRDASPVEPMTLGRFYRQAVVVAGPGMGKSTLLKRLAMVYARDGRPVARASLKQVAARMKEKGETFPEAFFTIALGGFPVPNARDRLVEPWILLADGLDECGLWQNQVATGLTAYAAANPEDAIVVVTRPIGYKPAPFDAWRHYEFLAFDSTSTTPHLADLVEAILKPQGKAPDDPYAWVAARTKDADPEALSARSPLLLSLSASLLARGKTLTGHVGDLYAQILTLIEEEAPARQDTPPPPSPIRNQVLDSLGDILVRTPLIPAQDAETEVARRLGVELGRTPLAATEPTLSAIAHWEAVGVVERLHHEGDQVLTFVHKTIGEYVAARYTVALGEEAKRKALRSLVSVPEGAEPLRYAAVLGAGDPVCEALLDASDGDAGYKEVIRSLTIVGDAAAKVSADLQTRIVERALDLFQSQSRRVSLEAGLALLSHLPAHGVMIATAVRPHLTDARNWVRLGAWAMSLKADAPDLDYVALKTLFAEIPALYRESLNLSMGRGLRLFSRSEGDFLQPFAISAARRILEREEAAVAKDLIEATLDVEHLGGFVFRSELKALSKTFKVPITLQHNKTRDWGDFFNQDEYTEDLRASYRLVLGPLVGASSDGSDLSIETPHVFADLAAFWTLCGFNSHLADGLEPPVVPGVEAAIAEIGRAAILLSGLSPERLGHQARAYLEHVNTPDQLWYELHQLPLVDVAPLEWRASAADVDPRKIEPLLYHPSDQTVFVAARAIDGCATVPVRLEIAERALTRGSGSTTGMAAALALATDAPEGLDLVYTRLQRSGDVGLRTIYQILKQQPPAFDARTSTAIARGLAASETIALRTAEWALAYAEPGRTDLLQVLETAYAHWVTAERPGEPGKAIPDSPRGALLEAIFKIAPPSLDRLIELVDDRRSEVQGAAHKEIAKLFATDPDAIAPIFDAVADRTLGRQTLNLFLQAPAHLTPDRLARLLDWFESDTPSVREGVVPLLAEPFMTPIAVAGWARRLIADRDFHVREAGHRLLRSLGAQTPPPESLFDDD
ncbi:hypothetical protein N0B44_29455 [Roseibacterium beibuensis]|uniref:hypothetical protein n=1 Tax=[Roseibacterium] beibuensis TaxID=1193142 RepID=UPI00217D53A5|nr:hypothetical protein [Roseibacterium beibuensis]MCS6627047.1 hypothetical protein [Roseibacterium beibuensis]